MVVLEHEVFPFETDLYGNLKPSQLLRYSMHMSSVQQESEGLHQAFLDEHHVGWMLARFLCTQTATVRAGETLRIVCSPRAVQTAYYIRQTQITRGGDTVAEVRMVWIPVNMETRRIYRVPELEKIIPDGVPAVELADLRRLPLPKELPEWGKVRVPYSLCDKNGHFSSANYIDVLCDAFGFWRDGPKRMESVQIDYHAEFLPEEQFVLFGGREDGCVTARGTHEDGRTGFVASLHFSPLED